jgi:ABC-2 type transport system ATP-binding protein
MGAVIRTDELSKRFGRVRAVEQLSLVVPEGAIFGLIGTNGAGKTTTIKLLTNILRASEGRAEVLGVESRQLSPKDWQRIGYVSENQELPDWMSFTYFLRYLKRFYPSWDDELAAEMLRAFDLPPARPLGKMSRGMRMKAALTSALAYRPKLIFLDEPFSGLDPLVRDEVTETLLERAADTTIFVSSHDLAELETFATHIGYMEDGRLVFAEEMTALTQRFRQVEVTLNETPAPEMRWPEHWLARETSPALVRFIEIQYEDNRTRREIAELFPGAANIELTAMPLRAVFVALARSTPDRNKES